MFGCVVSTKIQILKAIHNCCCYRVWYLDVVLYLRKYKFWKQFTTTKRRNLWQERLCCIYENTNFESNSQLTVSSFWSLQGCVVSTKIQILKAIHNQAMYNNCIVTVVLYLRKYKFWKQFTTITKQSYWKGVLCCIYENTNFESNSQPTFP